jgi:serine/threonine protein phosphatase PrpC
MPKGTTAPRTLRVSIGQCSDAGRKDLNQDFHGTLVPDGIALHLKSIILAIANGISSSDVSAAAFEIAVKSLLFEYYATPDAWSVRTSATRVIAFITAWLFAQNRSVVDINAGQVCTLPAVLLKGREAHTLHVGDSRICRVTGYSLEPLTKDHRRALSSEESYLARALGAEQTVVVDYCAIPLTKGDMFLLTTDGLHEFSTNNDLKLALALPDLDAAARSLVNAALAR